MYKKLQSYKIINRIDEDTYDLYTSKSQSTHLYNKELHIYKKMSINPVEKWIWSGCKQTICHRESYESMLSFSADQERAN